MCLIVLAREVHPDYPLILLAHRDEFTARPSAPLQWWPGNELLAGRDEQGGGSWLGVSRQGRLAAVTNVRQGPPEASARSRGALVTDWLTADLAEPDRHAGQLAKAGQYSGFNLLFGAWLSGQLVLHYASNRFLPRPVPAGVSALSNGDFDAPWPKSRRAKAAMVTLLASGEAPAEHWLDALADNLPAHDDELPDTGIGRDRERWLSPMLITSPHYGTRAASLLSLRRDGELCFIEHSLDPTADGRLVGVVRERLQLA